MAVSISVHNKCDSGDCISMKDVDIKSEIKKTVNEFIGSFHHIHVKIIYYLVPIIVQHLI